MKFSKFQEINLAAWNKYLRLVDIQFSNLGINLIKIDSILFPNIILFTETKSHFILELFGLSKIFNGLKNKVHKESSTEKYLYQFNPLQEEGEPTFLIEGIGYTGLNHIFLTRGNLSDFSQERFPLYQLWPGGINFIDGKGPIISLSKGFKNCYFNHCIIGNNHGNIHRLKYIPCMVIVNKKITETSYEEWLQNTLQISLQSMGNLLGVSFCSNKLEKNYLLAGQFSSIFLFPELRETTIGEFINKNPEIIQKSFNCQSFLYEPSFEWIEGNPDDKEQFINPDLIAELNDGSFIIFDLKTAALNKKNITKGGHRRRRFIDYVQEGIAQLANYKEYFKFANNQQYVQAKYNKEISDPTLILVVGNYDNAKKEEIREARRMLGKEYHIIDYDTLNTMFLKVQ